MHYLSSISLVSYQIRVVARQGLMAVVA